ncbi:A-kinase anchor protein 13-like isoform X4 [Periophthalmus magnuspinnatus]|uniref:A-kinase anchor protein 13-like isoform X4 n=1 Tax=Periophthalmus magnuspinnatus TaxID=409849 RepID=UPI00243638E7|nr:A-kinase anchor protein 13-like isoform X4 [Periophthalmus magnuspinnatus]
MKLNPTEAPLYGECVLTVQLEDNDTCPSPEEEDLVEFYLLFSGSSQRHLTSTVRASRATLQAVCPGHNVCEQVLVVLCVAQPNGAVIDCSQKNFTFVQDLALDTAHAMLNSKLHQKAPLWNDPKECKELDGSLVLALKHLTQLHRLGPCSSALPHMHSPREEHRTQTDNHENIRQDQTHCTTDEDSTDKGTEASTQCNSSTGQQQLSGLLHLAAADNLNRTSSFTPQAPGQRDTRRSGTDCVDTSQDHLQRIQLFTNADTNEELDIDPDGQVFQHHSKLGTFSLTLQGLHKWHNKRDSDFCLQDDVAQLRRRIEQYKGEKGNHFGTTAISQFKEEILDDDRTKPPQDSCVHGNSHLDSTSTITVGAIRQSQETEATQAAPRTGRNRRNKKRTTKTARTVTESPGSPLVAATGTASNAITASKPLSSTDQIRETVFTDSHSKDDFSHFPTSPDSDEQNSSRKTVASPATAIVAKQEVQKWEVAQIILDQETQNEVTELGLVEDVKTKKCLVILHRKEATEKAETMGQEQSLINTEKHSEKTASPEVEERVLPVQAEGTTVSDGAACYQGANSEEVMKEEPKSLSIWYDCEQLDMSKETDMSSPQLSTELCASPRQLSPTLTQPHATGLQPEVSHGSTSQRQEVLGSQRDEEAGPDWEKASREEVSAHSKRSSENDEDGHGDRSTKPRKKKRKKRGKRGGLERKQLSSTSSIESQSQTEIQMQLTDQNIEEKTGKTDIPTTSVPGTNTMQLPNQAEIQDGARDGTHSSNLETNLSELPGTTDFNMLGEISEDKTTIFHESNKLVWDTAHAQLQEMDVPVLENVETAESHGEKRELFDYINEVSDCNYGITVLHHQPSQTSPTELSGSHPDQKQFNEKLLEQLADKHLQLVHPLVNSPESTEPVSAFDSPVDGKTDVPPPQTREGSAEITTQGPSGHCLTSEILAQKNLEEENKNELWKEEEAKIGSLPRREVIELCANNIAGEGEGSFSGSELELAATAVAVVTVAVASAMATFELCQQLAENCTKTPGINPLEQKMDEKPALFNLVSHSDDTSPAQDITEEQAHCESQTVGSQNEFNIDFAQEFDSSGNKPDGTNQALTLDISNDVRAENLGLHQTIEATTHTDKQQDSKNQEPLGLNSSEQIKCGLTVEENRVNTLDNECIRTSSSDTNQITNFAVQEEVLDKISDTCNVLDTGQKGPLMPEVKKAEEIIMDVIDGVDEDCSRLKKTVRKESSDSNNSQPENVPLTIEEQAVPLSCDSLPSIIITHGSGDCPEENEFVESKMRTEESQKDVPDTKVAVVVEIKDDSMEILDQDGDVVDGWREREREKKNDKEHTAGTCSAEWEEPGSKRNIVDCLQALQIQRETDIFGPVQHCADPSSQTATSQDSKKPPLVCLQEEEDVSPETNTEDSVFKEWETPCTECSDQKVRVSWSSTDDASSVLGTFSEERSISISDPNTSRLSWKSEAEDTGLGEMEGGEEDERKDSLPENILTSAILRASRRRSLSPLRRHSWEPGRNDATSDMNMGQGSSLVSLSEESKPAKTPIHRRSMSWCPSNLAPSDPEPIDSRSYSLEGLVEVEQGPLPCEQGDLETGQEKGCFSEEGQQVLSMTASCPGMFHHQTLTKSISMVTISHRDIDGTTAFTCNPGSVEYSISEEEPGPLRSTTEGKGGPRISRTFSYLRNKMTKKGKEKEKERRGEKEREPKEKDKKWSHNHVFFPVCPPVSSCCQHCNKLLQTKECFHCSNCGVHVHKSCKDNVAVCVKNKNKLQIMAPDAAPPAVTTRTKSTSSTGSTISSVSSLSRERWSTATTPEDQFPLVQPKRTSSIFSTHGSLPKSISISNIAGLDDVTLKGLKLRSQSTDSLNQNSAVNASTESLTDEGTEMMDNQLMGEFESDIKDLEADSWSSTVDKKFLKTLKKDEIKRQDVIYELYQTEFHHVRTLRIMSEVYSKGIQKELQMDLRTLDKIFPVLDDLVETHTEFLHQLLEQRRSSSGKAQHSSLLVGGIGETLVKQFSGSSAERMKKVYGKFCSRHNEAVNHYKDLLAKDKRFQNFIKKVMSSTIVRRLSIPECILLVTQRITKYPVLIQRILQHTKETDLEHTHVSEALQLVKEILTAVDSKVNEQEKKRRLKEVHSRTDSKSIMRMKSGQFFAKEDLLRGRRLIHDGTLQLKNSAGRLKEVQSLLLSDVLVFLQEKDQKYVFASLDQRSTVISLQNLIVREVANEERGLFLITAGTEKPEMVEVLASSKEERNTWRAIIQDAMNCMEKDEDEGIPSETEEDKRQQESRIKEIRELLRGKDEQIVSLLEEKVHIFRKLSDCSAALYDAIPAVRERMLFRATPDDVTKGEPIIQEALKEVESLHSLVNTGLGGAACNVSMSPVGGSVGPVCLPRRAETFGGFDSHQMNISKNGEKEEADESVDLRRTESDGVLKKGATASLQLLLKRNNEQVQSSVTYLHDLLLSLQAVVVQQDSFIEDQRQTLNERFTANSSRHSSSSSLSSVSSSRPSSLIEQEKHRSLERQRQEAASLQKQQAAHLEEKRRREREWEVKERVLCEREEQLKEEEERMEKRRQELQEERELLQRNKEQYQRDLERLREAQLRLERDKEALHRDTERLEAQRKEQAEQLQRYSRTSSITSEDSVRFPSTSSLDLDCKEAEQSKEVELSTSAPTKEPFLRIGSKRMGKNFNPFASSSSKTQGAEKEPSRLLQLTKPKKDKKDKKKKKGEAPPTGTGSVSNFQKGGDNFSC